MRRRKSNNFYSLDARARSMDSEWNKSNGIGWTQDKMKISSSTIIKNSVINYFYLLSLSFEYLKTFPSRSSLQWKPNIFWTPTRINFDKLTLRFMPRVWHNLRNPSTTRSILTVEMRGKCCELILALNTFASLSHEYQDGKNKSSRRKRVSCNRN